MSEPDAALSTPCWPSFSTDPLVLDAQRVSLRGGAGNGGGGSRPLYIYFFYINRELFVTHSALGQRPPGPRTHPRSAPQALFQTRSSVYLASQLGNLLGKARRTHQILKSRSPLTFTCICVVRLSHVVSTQPRVHEGDLHERGPRPIPGAHLVKQSPSPPRGHHRSAGSSLAPSSSIAFPCCRFAPNSLVSLILSTFPLTYSPCNNPFDLLRRKLVKGLSRQWCPQGPAEPVS